MDVLHERSFARYLASVTVSTNALQRNVPEHALSRISSFDWLGSVALNPIGYAVIGPIAAAIGASETSPSPELSTSPSASGSSSFPRSAVFGTRPLLLRR